MTSLKTYLPASRKAQVGLAAGVAFVLLVVVGLFSVDGDRPSDIVLFIGRFHPLLVHLPIGFLIAAFLLEGIGRFTPFKGASQAVPFLLGFGALGAVAAAIAGSFLALGGGYDESLIFWHQRLGIAAAILAALALLFHLLMTRGQARLLFERLYGVLLVGMVGVLGVAGHLGGSLTHGGDYLTRYLPDPARQLVGLAPRGEEAAPAKSIEEARVYADLIAPIFEARCVECHNPSKTKGDLRLDTPEMILAGGETGDVVIPGDAEGSELFRRLVLPAHDDDRMPPEGDPLTLEQIELMRWWLDGGGSFEQRVAELEPSSPAIELVLAWHYGAAQDRPAGVFALDVPPPDPSAVEALQEAGASVVPIAQDAPYLQVHATSTFGDEEMALLRPLAQQVTWLDLGGTGVTDRGADVLAELPHLSRLHLERTSVTDVTLARLDSLDHLDYLNLYGTDVTDEGIAHLGDLRSLETVYLWQTDVTAEGAERLRAERPGLTVDLGVDTEAFQVEVAATEE